VTKPTALLPAATDDFTRLVNGFADFPADPTSPSAPSAPSTAEPSATPSAGTSEQTPPTAEERIAAKRALYEEYLTAEGYRYKVDEDGDISLRREGRWLVLFASDDDSQHFRLSFPAF
jgi:hypothetical protein